jgi:hypothetical protein
MRLALCSGYGHSRSPRGSIGIQRPGITRTQLLLSWLLLPQWLSIGRVARIETSVHPGCPGLQVERRGAAWGSSYAVYPKVPPG